ncbi:hypothetical protein QTO34_007850 [Cnephaeus nilssonii]|uniref:Uncharacterized protein n=1 Tax=Cnephaeus nilssonii TaxID=3371016 RepID=A0AA40HJ43_CNENI|nr:hypothetical protein QTO34_007850 [Eptesicus nilssonii]
MSKSLTMKFNKVQPRGGDHENKQVPYPRSPPPRPRTQEQGEAEKPSGAIGAGSCHSHLLMALSDQDWRRVLAAGVSGSSVPAGENKSERTPLKATLTSIPSEEARLRAPGQSPGQSLIPTPEPQRVLGEAVLRSRFWENKRIFVAYVVGHSRGEAGIDSTSMLFPSTDNISGENLLRDRTTNPHSPNAAESPRRTAEQTGTGAEQEGLVR